MITRGRDRDQDALLLPMLSVGGGWGGKKIRFESEEFNDRFTVRTDNPK